MGHTMRRAYLMPLDFEYKRSKAVAYSIEYNLKTCS